MKTKKLNMNNFNNRFGVEYNNNNNNNTRSYRTQYNCIIRLYWRDLRNNCVILLYVYVSDDRIFGRKNEIGPDAIRAKTNKISERINSDVAYTSRRYYGGGGIRRNTKYCHCYSGTG